MPTPPQPTIREALLELVHDMEAKRQGGNLQQTSLLRAAEQRLVKTHGDRELEQAILTQWQELFRTGLLAWGFDLNNPNPPFFHLTAVGLRALSNATRDPSNPAGYLKHLDARATVNPVALSYLVEALNCYVAGLFKAAAVMVGAAAESIVLDLAEAAVARLEHDDKPVPQQLKQWMVRPLTTELAKFYDAGIDKKEQRALRERYETYWSAFTGQIRAVRNDAGHPVSIDPVTADTVHASLLIFPELASLAEALFAWTIKVP